MRAHLRTAAARLRRFMTDPQLPVSAGAPLTQRCKESHDDHSRRLHDHSPGTLVDQVSREPQRVVGLVGAPPDADALNRPDA